MNQLVYNPDTGGEDNFAVTYVLEADATYILGARFCSSRETGSFDVKLQRNDSFDEAVEKESTCTEDGQIPYSCSVCGKIHNITIPASHTWESEVTTSNSCTEDGVMTYTCSVCGATETEVIPATDHTWESEITTPSSCTEDGVETFTCSSCGETETETIPATGHSWNDKNVCSACGYTLSEGGACGDNLTWSLDNSGTLTISGSGAMTKYSTDSEAPWYQYGNVITELIIGENVTDLSKYGLRYFENLETIRFNATAMNAPQYDGIFYRSSMNTGITVVVGANVTEIPERLFSDGHHEPRWDVMLNCNGVTSVIFEKGSQCESIGGSAFAYCYSLRSITIPESVTSIGPYAFLYCKNLLIQTEASLPETLGAHWATGAAVCTNAVKLGVTDDGLEYWITDDQTAHVWKYHGNDTIVVIPETIEGATVVEIATSAFFTVRSSNSITYAEIPDSVITIGAYAFQGCVDLEKIVIPKNVKYIGESAFRECTNVSEIYFYATAMNDLKIGNDAFYYVGNNTDDTKAIIGSGVTRIPDYLFASANLTSVEFEKGSICESIGNYAFYSCGTLSQITLPESVTVIGEYAFGGCTGLTQITIHEDMKTIGERAFYNCSGLRAIDFNATAMNDLSRDTFAYAGTDGDGIVVTIGENVTYIPRYLFHSPATRCAKIAKVVFEEESRCTSIGSNAFYGCAYLTSIRIPESVRSFGGRVFAECAGLVSAGPVGNGYNLEFSWEDSIPDSAFSSSELSEIVLPDSIRSVGAGAFSYCDKLAGIDLPSELIVIGEGAFDGCSGLLSISIPEKVETIGKQAFKQCSSLSEIVVRAVSMNNLVSDTFYGAGRNNRGIAVRIGASCTKIPANMFKSYAPENSPNITTVVFDKNSNCKSIGSGAFANASALTEMTLPASVTSIETYAFSNCTALASVTIPESVTSIETYAFSNCTALAAVAIPKHVTSIGAYAFSKCTALANVTIPGSVTSFAENVFSGCSSLTSAGPIGGEYSIAFGWTEGIPEKAFYGCDGLTSATIPDGTTSVGANAFWGCQSLAKVVLPASISEIGKDAFYQCRNLTSVGPIGGGYSIEFGWTESIPEKAFYEVETLTSVALPTSISKIGSGAFYGCSGLKEITIPENVTSLGVSAFHGCTNVEKLWFNATAMDNLENKNYVFGDLGFNTSGVTVRIGANVTRIPDYLLCSCVEGSWASKVTKVVFEEGSVCSWIGSYALCGCSKLKEITIPASVTSLGAYAFYGCTNITGVVFEENSACYRIGAYAFYGCGNLTDIKLPDSVTVIGACAFSGCPVKISNVSVSSVDDYAFYDCSNITSATILGGTGSVGTYAFYGTGLTSVTIPVSVMVIEDYAFGNTPSLKDVYYGGSEVQWEAIEVGEGNNSLKRATIHYNCDVPDAGGHESREDGTVRYFVKWDAEKQIAYFDIDPDDNPANLGSKVTEKTDTSFLENVDELVGTYVLVQTKLRDDGMVDADFLISIKPVTTKYGVVTAKQDNGMVVIDDMAFQSDITAQFTLDVGDAVRYYLLDGSQVGSIAAQDLSMCGQVSAVDGDLVTIGTVQYSISPFASELTRGKLQSAILLEREVDFFADGGIIFQARLHQVPYDVPEMKFDYDQLQDPAKGYVLNYRDEWLQAYQEYTEAVLAALRAYAGNTEVQKSDTIKAQAQAMQEHDEKEYDKYITVRATQKEDFEKYKDKAYEALATYFYEELSNYSVPTLNAIDPEKPLSGAKFVAMFLQNIGQAKAREYTVDGVKIRITPHVEAMGLLGLGSLEIIGTDVEATLGNSQENIQETLTAFVKELQSYTKTQTYKAVDLFFKETDELGIYKVSKEWLSNIETRIKEKMEVVWDTIVEKAGLGDLMQDLDTCYNYFRFAEQAIDTLKSADIKEALEKISKLTKFENKTIKDAAVGKAMDKLKKAAKKYDRSLVEYMDGTIEDKEKSFWRFFFNCPVEVAVYNSAGTQVGYIGEDDLWYSDGLVIRRAGEAKEIIIQTEDLPTFVATATDYGTMSVVVEEYSNGIPSGRLNYYDVALVPNANFSITPIRDIQANAGTLALQSSSGPIYASEYISAENSAAVNIGCAVEGVDGQTACGAGVYVRGNPVVVYTKSVEGYDFVGWYDENGSLVSSSVVYSFTAREDRELTARFCQDTVVNVDVSYGDGGIAIGGGRYDANRLVTVFAIPDSGYAFSGWYANGLCVSNNEEYCFELSGDVDLEARFAIQAHTHTYSAPDFSWSKDYSCSAAFSCENCGQVESIRCTVTSVTTPPTETEAEKTVYTATVTFNDQVYTDTVTVSASSEVRVNIDGIGLNASDEVWIDGVPYCVQSDGNGLYVALPDATAHTMVTYSYNDSNATDIHTKYPTGMRVWKLKQENGLYTAEYIPALDDLLQYSGSSIRIVGNKGIRMITSISQNTRNALTGNGLAGFKLLEYGTLLAQTSKLGEDPLVLGGEHVKSNYAYKKGVADPVFRYTNGLIQYTNVLVGFTEENCKEDIAMRPYIKLQDESGEVVTIYGGIVYRSVGYIAYQNRKAFSAGSAAYEYVWSIIHYVYGNQYDTDYKK